MKLSKLISALQEVKAETGDVDVFMSSDAEGNDYHSMPEILEYANATLSPIDGNSIVKGIILYPNHDTWDTLDN